MNRKWNPARTARTDRGREAAINIGEEMDAATTKMMKTETPYFEGVIDASHARPNAVEV